MKKLVKELYSDADFAAMTQNLKESILIAEAKGVALSKKQRRGGRRLGPARQGYCRLVLPIAVTNINELPRNTEPQQLADLLENHDRIRELRSLALKFLEWIDDTWIANGMDAVSLTDTFVSSLHRARKNNDAIDLPMTELDNYNKRHTKQIGKEDKHQDAGK